MSSWIVSQDHIDALVCGAIVHGLSFDGEPVTPENATEVGQALWDENHRGVNYRYGRGKNTPTYSFIGETRLNPINLFKQAGCYDYQSCDRPAYRKSAARRLVDDLQEACLAELGIPRDEAYNSREYDRAPWGI